MGELMPIKYNIEKRIKAMKQKDILDCNKQYIADFIDYQAAEGNSKARQAKYCSILSKIGQHVKYDFKEAELKQIQELKNGSITVIKVIGLNTITYLQSKFFTNTYIKHIFQENNIRNYGIRDTPK